MVDLSGAGGTGGFGRPDYSDGHVCGSVCRVDPGIPDRDSYSKLSELYPQAGTGSSYYFTEQAMLAEGRLSSLARLSKFIVGWFSHLYYWVYPGVMVAMMATLISYIFSQFGVDLSAFW